MRSKLTPRQAQRLCQTILMSVPLLSLTGCMQAMSTAAQDGRNGQITAMLDQGGDINARGRHNLTPLQNAVMEGRLETVRLLIDRGADPNARMENAGTLAGLTPLMLALKSREIATALLDKGADPSLRDRNGRSALDIARDCGTCREVVRVLEAAEAEGPEKRAQRAARKAKEQSSSSAFEENRNAIEASEKAADAAAKSGDSEKALGLYSEALRLTPRGTDKDIALRKKLLRFVASLDPRPAVPQEALRHRNRSQAFIKKSQDAEGYNSAASELDEALRIAPWWAAAYFNLGLVQEKAENFTGAIQNFKLYLMAAPESSDAPAVRKKIDELEVSQELSERKAAP